MGSWLSASRNKVSNTVTIGPYVIELSKIVGSGAFGTVYLGSNKETRDVVAAKEVKTLLLDKEVEKEYVEKLQKSLNDEIVSLVIGQGHPNIIKYLDISAEADRVWIVMEYCEQGDLLKYLKQTNRRLPKDQLMRFLIDGSESVNFLHQQTPPVVHRDIKLSNFLLFGDRKKPGLKLCDFGLVKLLPEDTDIRTFYMSTVAGTVDFMAPEFFTQDHIRYTKSVDVFSLGLVFQILINFNGTEEFLNPYSVQISKSKMVLPFGNEVALAKIKGHPMPELFEYKSGEEKLIAQLKELTVQMVNPSAKDRIEVQAVRDKLVSLKI